jgi:hypothetical protein
MGDLRALEKQKRIAVSPIRDIISIRINPLPEELKKNNQRKKRHDEIPKPNPIARKPFNIMSAFRGFRSGQRMLIAINPVRREIQNDNNNVNIIRSSS